MNISSLLHKILKKVCQRHERRGSLSGIMKLGQDLEGEEQQPLENFFGLNALKYTGKNELKLSFDHLLEGKSSSEINDWLLSVYQLIGRKRPEPEPFLGDDVDVVLDRLRLAYPRLGQIHSFLQQDKIAIDQQLAIVPEHTTERLFTAAKIVDFLQDNSQEITLSELGAKFCGNSKELRQGELHKTVAQWLRLLLPYLPKNEPVWQEFLVIQDRLTISALLFAPLIYYKNGRKYDWINQLYQAGEPAVLNWFHLEGITSCSLAPANNAKSTLITCENEAPFSQLLRTPNLNQILIFTAGFPNRTVRRLYQLLAPLCSSCRHWGDSDPAGLRIAAILRGCHPLDLWRCDLATLKRHHKKLLPVSKNQAQIGATILNNDPNFPFSPELAFTLKHGWLEQESWQESVPS